MTTRDLTDAARAALTQRLTVLRRALEPVQPSKPLETRGGLGELLDSVAAALAPVVPERAWLLLAVVTARLPLSTDVLEVCRLGELDGARAVVDAVVRSQVDGSAGPGEPAGGDRPRWPTVRVVRETTVVDVHHTAASTFATGIQRVTREAIRRWATHEDVTLIGWHHDLQSLRALSPPEVRRALEGGAEQATSEPSAEVLVPWRCTYLLPELAADVPRAERLAALAQLSGTSFNLIGYDLVPITTAETSFAAVLPGFARNLAATRHARNVAPISAAAGQEYLGWRHMLAAAGLPGPRIDPVVLPAQPAPEDASLVAAARRRLTVGSLPLVLVVGSHEPRKNHLAVLHAAELLWRERRAFSLTFIGGNSWGSEDFHEGVRALAKAGRPIESISAASDDLLWGAYRVARFTVFPSLNEGYGLPVAESLASGTPVVTSQFGAMREIAEAGGGALLIDPRDDHALAAGMRALLSDDGLLHRLEGEAAARPTRTWDEYAAEVWEVLTRPSEAV